MKWVNFFFKTDFSGGEKNSDNAYEHKKDYFATATTEAEQKTNSSCLCASLLLLRLLFLLMPVYPV